MHWLQNIWESWIKSHSKYLDLAVIITIVAIVVAIVAIVVVVAIITALTTTATATHSLLSQQGPDNDEPARILEWMGGVAKI